MRSKWYNLPANARTVMGVMCSIDYLKEHHPYPANMKVDRTNFAVARLGYEVAIYNLEKFQCSITEEIEMAMLEDEQIGGE